MGFIIHLGELYCQKIDDPRAFERFLDDTGGESDVEILRTDSGQGDISDSFVAVCDRNRTRRGITNTNVPALDDIVEGGIAIADTMQKGAPIQTSIPLAESSNPESMESLWGGLFFGR